MEKKPFNKTMSFRMKEEDFKVLVDYIDERDVNLSAWVRRLLLKDLENKKKQS